MKSARPRTSASSTDPCRVTISESATRDPSRARVSAGYFVAIVERLVATGPAPPSVPMSISRHRPNGSSSGW